MDEQTQKNWQKIVSWYGDKDSALEAAKNPVSEDVIHAMNLSVVLLKYSRYRKEAYLIMKKRFTLILGACIFGLTLITGGIAAEAGYSSQKNITTDNTDKTNITKDNLYYDYTANILESAIKNNNEIQDCEITINHSNSTITSVNVKITAKNNELNTMDTDIKDYISQALEIPLENITLTK